MNKFLWVLLLFFSISAFSKEYYVSVIGNDDNDGLSETTAWRTISYAAIKAKEGDTVWIKAGNYGDENVIIKGKGKKDKPISFIGYKQTPGDIHTMYYKYTKGRPMNPKNMPMLDGKNRANGLKGISLNKSKYIIVKNIQIKNYRWGIHGGNASNSIVERILAISFGDVNSKAASGYGAQYGKGGNNLIKECIFINATGANLRLEGDNNIIDNVKSYSDDNSTGEISATDYYIHINGGNNNLIKNSYVERVGNLDHTGHGIGLKYNCENNIIENCEVVNVKGAIEFRHSGVKNNIAKNILIKGPLGTISFRDGANNNIVENTIVQNSNEGIRFYDQTEDGQGGLIASNNIVKNTIFSNVGVFISATKSKKVSKIGYISNNKVINCTIDKSNSIFKGELPMDSSNEIINSTFINVQRYENKKSKYQSKWKNINNNYFNNGFNSMTGNGNISENPQFEDAAKKNYRLKPGSKLINAGKKLIEIKKDFDGNKRPQGSSHDIGAFEFSNSSVPSVFKADAGMDQIICLGDNVTLTASGGSIYEWSNGAITASITVSPTATKKYTVTVKEGNKSDTDEVLVTVDNVTANAGSDITINVGDSTTLTASGGDSYLWSTGETTASISVNPISTETYKVTVTNNNCKDTDEVLVTVSASSAPQAVIAYAGEDQTICLGETVILTASGGSSYEWSNGETTSSIKVSPITNTKYTVTVKDRGETDIDNVNITVNSVTANAGADITINVGETTILTASGGDTYFWSNGATTKSISVSPSATKTYKVTVIKNSCEDTDNVKVTVSAISPPPSIVVAYAGEDIEICVGESVTLTASGGSRYEWSNGAVTESITVNPTNSKIYSVKVYEGSNSDTDEVLITVNNVIANAGSNITINEGSSTTLTASGGKSYLWSTGETTKSISVSPINTKIYTVTVFSNNCEDNDSVQVTVNKTSQPADADAGIDVTICIGETAILKAKGGKTYLWSTGDTNKNIKVSPTRTTTYTLTATRGGTTNSDTVIVYVDNCKDINVVENLASNFEVYPNPTTGVLNVNVKNVYNDINMVLISLNGSIVYNDRINSNRGYLSKQIDLSRYAKGVYFIRLYNSNQNIVKKIVLN